jgi:hypothetical protein
VGEIIRINNSSNIIKDCKVEIFHQNFEQFGKSFKSKISEGGFDSDLDCIKFISLWSSNSNQLLSYIAYTINESYIEVVFSWTSKFSQSTDSLSEIYQNFIDRDFPEIRIRTTESNLLENKIILKNFNLFGKEDDFSVLQFSKRISVMQPYFFPSLRYYQLASSTSKFVFLDDVNFKKNYYINKNFIRDKKLNEINITVPVIKASQNKLIIQTEISSHEDWAQKIKLKIKHCYSNFPNFKSINQVINSVLETNSPNISELAIKSITAIFDYLDIKINFYKSSENFSSSKNLEKSDRLLSISHSLNSKFINNPIGGQTIYDKNYFLNKGVMLSFINTQQGNPDKIDFSIIDDLMRKEKDAVKKSLLNYTQI